MSRRSNRDIGDVYLAMAYYNSGGVVAAHTMLEALAAEPSTSTAARAGAALAGVLARARDADGARRAMADVLNRTYRDHHVAWLLPAERVQPGAAIGD